MATFIDSLARDAPPQFQPMLQGIGSWYRRLGHLTIRQAVLFEINANKQGKSVPDGLFDTDQPAFQPNQSQVLATLLDDMAAAILKASEQLRK